MKNHPNEIKAAIENTIDEVAEKLRKEGKFQRMRKLPPETVIRLLTVKPRPCDKIEHSEKSTIQQSCFFLCPKGGADHARSRNIGLFLRR